MSAEALLGPLVDTTSIFRAHVLALAAGTVVVRDVANPTTVTECDMLAGPDGRPPIAVGDPVLAWRQDGAPRGVVIGRIDVGGVAAASSAVHGASGPGLRATLRSEGAAPSEAPVDELVFEAKQNLTLKCGDGSITIRADGKILIKGKDLVSHAQRTNRIKGGSVAIN